MKAEERHHLKQNEFAVTAAKVAGTMAANRDRIMIGGIALVVVAALVGGYFYWNKRTNDQASGMLGRAMATAQAQVVPAPTLPGATQPAGTYPTEQATRRGRDEGFQEVATAYPSTPAGIAAQYHAATSLMAVGRLVEAEQKFRAVTASAGNSIYASMAKMGLVTALVWQSKFDDAIKTLNDLSGDRDGDDADRRRPDGIGAHVRESRQAAGRPRRLQAHRR